MTAARRLARLENTPAIRRLSLVADYSIDDLQLLATLRRLAIAEGYNMTALLESLVQTLLERTDHDHTEPTHPARAD